MRFTNSLQLGIVSVLFFINLLWLPIAEASHARYGHINWEPRTDLSETTVDFRIVTAFRRSYFGNLQLGDKFSPGSISFGDGKSGNYSFEVIALNAQEDWVIGQASQAGMAAGVVRHQYPTKAQSNGQPWQVQLSVCCRIGSLRNSANSNFIVFATVDLSKDNSSPVSSLPPIVTCARGECRFSVPVIDKEQDKIRWSLTALGQSGISRQPSGLTLDSETGFIDWSQGSESADLGLYALSVTIQDLDEFDEPKSTVVTDFIINLRDFIDNQPPSFDSPPTPTHGATIKAIVGQALEFDLQASDSDLNDYVFINNLGLPDGASVTSIEQGNPSVVRFHWQPELKDLGQHILTFTATDQKVASALPRSVTVEVIKPIISDVRVIDRISAQDIDVEESTFSMMPTELRLGSPISEIEWQYPTFEIGQNENIQFDLRLKNLQPGETRLVIHELELNYKDVNGALITEKLGTRAVQVAETVLDISTATDRIIYRPQETVWVNTRIQNLDEADSDSQVRVEITDGAGVRVQLLTEQAISIQGLQHLDINQLRFDVGNLPAGDYQAQALLIGKNGKQLAAATSPFKVVTSSGEALSVATHLSTDKPRYGRWDTVQLHGRTQNTSTNAALGSNISRLIVYAPSGEQILHEDSPLSSLAPAAIETFPFSLALNAAETGRYNAKWLLIADNTGEVLSQSEAFFEVESIAIQNLLGKVQVDNERIYHTGQTQCRFNVTNRAPETAQNIELAYSLIHADSEALLSRQILNTNLMPDEASSWQLPFSAINQPFGGYACVLEANINGTWQVLASASFEVQPPKVRTSISTAPQGRVLVLTDEPRQCSALEDIQIGFEFGSELQLNHQITVRLFDENGTLLDTEIVHSFDALLNERFGAAADMAVQASASGAVQIQISSTAQGLKNRYRVEVEVRRNFLSKTTKSWSFDSSCDRPFTLGELWEDVTLLGWKPWRYQNEVKDSDPFGPLAGPSVTAQNAYLEAVLQGNGWDYTLVHSAEDFEREHRLGDYSSYLLLAERPQLRWQVQKELREAVFAGKGLIVAGSFDKRNLWLEPALGVTVVGRHPWATHLNVREGVLGTQWSSPLAVTDTVQAVVLQGADVVADYELYGDNQTNLWQWLDQGVLKISDLFRFKRNAISHYQYGQGQSIYFGFDWLLQASDEGRGGQYEQWLVNALQQVQPAQPMIAPYAVVPVDILWRNERGATTAHSTLTLPDGAMLAEPRVFEQVQTNQWHAHVELQQHEQVNHRIYVQLGEQTEQAIQMATYTADGTQQWQQIDAGLNYDQISSQSLKQTENELDALAWRYWYRLDYRSAWLKFKLAREEIEHSHYYSAQDLLLLTSDLLLLGNEPDVATVRQQIQQHLRLNGRLLATEHK